MGRLYIAGKRYMEVGVKGAAVGEARAVIVKPEVA